MRHTIYNTPVINTAIRGIAWLYLKVFGWRMEGETPPEVHRCVMLCAPHTSNWDLPFALAFLFFLRIRVYWMGKDSIFKWPFAPLLMWLGGIPIDRSKAHNIVGAHIQAFKEYERLTLGIAPEATRTRVARWKTGFYHIAKGANVPIVTGYLDFKRKVGGFGPTIMPSGDMEADMATIRDFYAAIAGQNPENYEPAWVFAKPRKRQPDPEENPRPTDGTN